MKTCGPAFEHHLVVIVHVMQADILAAGNTSLIVLAIGQRISRGSIQRVPIG